MPGKRVAIIGCGGRSRGHFQAYQRMADVQIVGCCDISAQAREKCGQEFGTRPYADAAAMIRTEKPDVVNLVTMPDSRVELMTLVSDLGVPGCVVEKPIAAEVEDWQKLCRLEAAGKTRFAVSHQCRWQPNLVKCRQALRSGKLGRVKFLDMSAGMNISGQGTHILNYARFLNEEARVVRVFGAAGGNSEMNGVHPAPDTTAGYLTFDNGVRALWNNGTSAPRCGDPEISWKHIRVAAYAERGQVCWEEFARWEIASPEGVERGDYGGMAVWEEKNILSQIAFHQALFDWLENPSVSPGTNLNESLHEWKVVLALYASALFRRPIELDNFDPPADLFSRLEDALTANG
jgi:predicted dehydrogenase